MESSVRDICTHILEKLPKELSKEQIDKKVPRSYTESLNSVLI